MFVSTSGFTRSDARALFERIVNNFPPERARPIWDRWARYEYQFGSLEAAQLLDKRVAEIYPNGASLPHISHLTCPLTLPFLAFCGRRLSREART